MCPWSGAFSIFAFLGGRNNVKHFLSFFYHCTPLMIRDVTTRKIKVGPRRWWAEYAPPPSAWNGVKVSDNLGATVVVLVAPVDTSLNDGLHKLPRSRL